MKPLMKATSAALAQIRLSLQQDGAANLGLRIAATRGEAGAIEYRLGLDEPRGDDSRVEIGGIYLLIAPDDEELLSGATVDYVEIEPGERRFIFLNPNDPSYVPPKSD